MAGGDTKRLQPDTEFPLLPDPGHNASYQGKAPPPPALAHPHRPSTPLTARNIQNYGNAKRNLLGLAGPVEGLHIVKDERITFCRRNKLRVGAEEAAAISS